MENRGPTVTLTTTDTALAGRGLDFSYGQLQVLFDVDVEVRRGEVLALLGTNGAGKSTLLKVLTGLVTPSSGNVEIHGKDVTSEPAEARVRRGLAMVPGGKAVFPSMTVHENLTMAAYTLRRQPALVAERIDEVVALFPKLGERMGQQTGSLSGGERQMVAVAKGMILHPSILCIDELSLGLAPVVVQELLEVVETLRAIETTMVIVEQSLNVALTLSDRAVFMEKGQVRFEGSAQELMDRDDLARAVFLGGKGG